MSLYIKTFGCQMNSYDSEKMATLLKSEMGYELVDNPTKADVLLINTCSVRDKAQHKLYSELGRWKSLKEARPTTIIGVGGCVASQEGSEIIKNAPFVDLVFGPQTLHRLPSLIKRARYEKAVDVSFPEIEKFDSLPIEKKPGVLSSVSIMEGCSKYCSFCVVPYTRGEEFSRPFEDVIKEIFTLATNGVKEILLLGQNVNAYRSRTKDGSIVDLAGLLYYVAAIPGIGRIRYTTSHPIEFTDRLISAHVDLPELVKHVHLPVQSGSDRILAQMKRGYTIIEYKSIIRKLKKAVPDVSISSDFIVGFPGENENDFNATLDLVDKVGFDQSYSFVYSSRPGTPAASLEDSVCDKVKKERLSILQNKLKIFSSKYSNDMLGSQKKVLVSSMSKKSKDSLTGRTENNRVVNFVGDKSLIGSFIDVEITEVLPNSLRGTVI